MTDKTTTGSDAVDLDALEAKARAATSGEWKVERLTGGYHNVGIRVHGANVSGYAAFINTRWPHEAQEKEQEANAAFIAAANPVTVLALIAQARAAEKVETEMAERLRRIVACHGDKAVGVHTNLLAQAADECDRFYNGMMAWKRTAQAKDREFAEARAAAPAATDRDILADAIAHAAEKRGIIKAGTALTGPQLVMLCADLAEAPPVLLQAATERQKTNAELYTREQWEELSQQPVQAAGDDFTAHSPDCRNYGCTGCADPAEMSRLLAPAIAAPTAPNGVTREFLERCLSSMKQVVTFGETGTGRPPSQTCMFEIEELEAILSAPTATAEPVAIYQIWDNGPAMWSDVSQDQYNRCNRAERRIVYAAPAPQQAAPLTDAPAAAWMTEDGQRVVPAHTMEGARRDGGAMLSSLKPYTVALVRAGSAASAGDATPGYKLVPLKPTAEMLVAGAESEDKDFGLIIHNCYCAMIAAAPTIDRAAMAATKEKKQ